MIRYISPMLHNAIGRVETMQKIDATKNRTARFASRSSDFMISSPSPNLHRPQRKVTPLISPHNVFISSHTRRNHKAEKPKEVHFDPVVCIKTFKTSPCETSWYSQEELCSFEGKAASDIQVIRRLMKDLKRKGHLNSYEALVLDATPIRGIGHYIIPEVFQQALSQQHSVISAVLAEQQLQRLLKVTRPDALAFASVTKSYVARERGVELGMSDASEAKIDIIHDN